jgi:hypothetical protein
MILYSHEKTNHLPVVPLRLFHVGFDCGYLAGMGFHPRCAEFSNQSLILYMEFCDKISSVG